MANLNPPQQLAVNHVHGPLLVLAGAGTGKTRVITFRIARLISRGVPPERILGVTFTNKAAQEMQDRLELLLGKRRKRNSARPLLSTFHSLCVRILRRHSTKLGYPEKFAIYAASDQESLARTVLREIKVSDTTLAPRQLMYHISNWKNRGLNYQQAQQDAVSDEATLAAIAYRRYQQTLKKLGAVDFDDLLLLTAQLFQRFPDARLAEAQRFDQILIDEYQDTNRTQYQIVRALAAEHRNLCVVGDDDQSIYGWRGAEIEHILNFKRDWPDAETVRLIDNYRSTQAILDVANRLIEHNRLRHGKVLRSDRQGGPPPVFNQFPDENKEADGVVAAIQAKIRNEHRQPRDFAVLFRTNEQTRVFEAAFRKAKLPYVLIGGMSFFDRKEVQDVVCYLRLLGDDPDDPSVLRILNRPPRGVGKKAAEALLDASVSRSVPVWKIVCNPTCRPAGLGQAAERGLDQLLSNVDAARRSIAQAKSLVQPVFNYLESVDYKAEIERLYTDTEERESRWNVVQQVVDALGNYERDARQPTLIEFLDDLLLGDRDIDHEKEKQLRKNSVFLMTIHASKGLEFPEVFLVGLEEGILPHHRSMDEDARQVDEERRLCYVGVTRAQDTLTLSMALTRMKWGKPRPRLPSRFVYELFGKSDHPNYQKSCQSTAP